MLFIETTTCRPTGLLAACFISLWSSWFSDTDHKCYLSFHFKSFLNIQSDFDTVCHYLSIVSSILLSFLLFSATDINQTSFLHLSSLLILFLRYAINFYAKRLCIKFSKASAIHKVSQGCDLQYLSCVIFRRSCIKGKVMQQLVIKKGCVKKHWNG